MVFMEATKCYVIEKKHLMFQQVLTLSKSYKSFLQKLQPVVRASGHVWRRNLAACLKLTNQIAFGLILDIGVCEREI